MSRGIVDGFAQPERAEAVEIVAEQAEMRDRVAHRLETIRESDTGSETPRQCPHVHLTQEQTVADAYRVAVSGDVISQMLPRHRDDAVAIHRDMRVGNLIVDHVVDAAMRGAQMLVVKRAVEHEVVVDTADQAILAQGAHALRGLNIERHGRVRTLVDIDIVGLQQLEAAQTRLANARSEKARMALGVGREDHVGQGDNRVAQNIEMGVTGFSFPPDMYVEIFGGDTPVGRSGVASAGREETVSHRVVLTLELPDFLDLEPE